jgi:hypothetical protein
MRRNPVLTVGLVRAGLFIVVGLFTVGAMAASKASAATPNAAVGQIVRVGPNQRLTSVTEASRVARSGDTVLIEAGDYIGDVAAWPQNNLTVRGTGGRVRMIADGKSAEAKGIWVIKGTNIVVEHIEFSGARVPDGNGAGIRHEGGKLTLRGCRFYDNENGVLTWNNSTSELSVENSEFHHNGAGDGRSHNLYVGEIARLSVIGSYFHHARTGHLMKSRAAESYVMYNRLTDEITGRASYELEFPSGGIAYVVGNIIEQGPQTENSTFISFGAEGFHWPQNELYLVNNTLVDDASGGGNFLQVAPGTAQVLAINNLLLGRGSLGSTGAGQYRGNVVADRRELAAPPSFDYRLRKGSALVGKAQDPGTANGTQLRPLLEYVHPMQTRPLRGMPYSPGAVQSVAP